jgi:hypothetical protein
MIFRPRAGHLNVAWQTVVWDASFLPAEIGAVDALARLKLLARRNGAELVLKGVSPELHQLIDLAGLLRLIATSPWCFRHQTDG